MVGGVMFHLVTSLELQQITEKLEELSALANSSEYSKKEVKELLKLLKSLTTIDTEVVLELNKKVKENGRN